MAEIIIMPKLGYNMDEGQLVTWCKNVGDAVAKGEVLFEINTDKTTMPVESTVDGVLLKTMLEEGEYADVFTPIAVIGQAGEDPDAALAASGSAPAEAQKEVAPATVTASGSAKQATAAPVPAPGKLKLTPKARKLIADENIDPASLASVQGTGFRGGITAKDIKASPLARKLAALGGIDLATVQGSGVGGKVLKADVATASAPSSGTEEKKVLSVTPYKGVRKIIGERLAESMSEAPHIYFTDSVDTTALTAFRTMLNESGGVKVAVSDLLIMAASRALRQHPEVNSSLQSDQIITYVSTNIGIAVAGDNGLIVPVVKNAQDKTLTEIAVETRDLVERAKVGRLAPEEYSGGTFSISNLGPFGIENFTAIVNPPESAILAVSAVKKVPVVVTDECGNDAIVVRPMMKIQLSVDHRVIDGLLAASFVKYFKELLQNPIRIVI
ncbi:MAG: 2-oxo acid dehydrogenase subunit E2 [Planctomycetaceae bacterium]|nr:2-oxo acid dehydrogenase subunit E2 [Planctomycetaceae bacterium]